MKKPTAAQRLILDYLIRGGAMLRYYLDFHRPWAWLVNTSPLSVRNSVHLGTFHALLNRGWIACPPSRHRWRDRVEVYIITDAGRAA